MLKKSSSICPCLPKPQINRRPFTLYSIQIHYRLRILTAHFFAARCIQIGHIKLGWITSYVQRSQRSAQQLLDGTRSWHSHWSKDPSPQREVSVEYFNCFCKANVITFFSFAYEGAFPIYTQYVAVGLKLNIEPNFTFISFLFLLLLLGIFGVFIRFVRRRRSRTLVAMRWTRTFLLLLLLRTTTEFLFKLSALIAATAKLLRYAPS